MYHSTYDCMRCYRLFVLLPITLEIKQELNLRIEKNGSPFLEACVPVRQDINAQSRLYVIELGLFMRQHQQHVGPFAQRKLHNCAPPHLHGHKNM